MNNHTFLKSLRYNFSMPLNDSYFKYLPELYIVLDPSLCVLDITDTYLLLIQLNRNEVLGKSIFDIFSQRKNIENSLNFVLQNKQTHQMEPIKSGDRYLKATHSPILNPSHELQAIFHKAENLIDESGPKFPQDLLIEANSADILNSISDGFFSLDAQLNFTNANSVTLSYFNLPLEKVVGKNLDDFSPNETDRLKFRERYLRVLKYGEPIDFIEKYGEIVLQTKAYRTTNGQIAIFFKDITEARKHENRLKVITDQLPSFVAYIDREGRYQFVNHSYEKWFNRSASEIIGKRSEDFAPVEAVRMTQKHESLVLSGVPGKYENILVRENGERLDLVVEFSPHKDEFTHEILGAVIVGHNVTSLKKAYREVEHSRQQLSDVLNDAPVAIALLEGPEHIFTFVNEEYYKLLGRRELLKKPMSEVTLDVQKSKEILDNVYSSGIAHIEHEFDVVLKNGSVVYINYIIKPYEGNSNKGIMIVAFNVTETVLSKRKVEEAVKIRDEFLSIASHELKTPLTSMQLQADVSQRIIQDENLPREIAERLLLTNQKTKKGIVRLARLVDDMLDISTITHGKLILRFEDFFMNQLVEEVLERMSPQFEQLNIPYSLTIKKAVHGSWDRFRIDQVITNLLSNAMKYGNKTPIAITLNQDREYALLSISDQGPGIALNNQRRIFERFERVMDISSARGLGLGLYICKEIVVRHGGQIEIESKLGQGATFIVKLPLAPLKTT
jgi:PAS domain S-box-containing protein